MGTTPRSATRRTGTDRDRLTVVLADDERDLRVLAREVLEGDGRFRVVAEAENGDKAVVAAAVHRPDLVVLDLDMPHSGGEDALPRIHSASPRTRVVVLTGHPDGDRGESVLDNGAVGFLEKRDGLRHLPDELVTLGGFLELVAGAVDERRASLAGELQSASAARRLVSEALRRWDCTELLETVTLLVSELVTNAIVHGGSDVEISVQLRPQTLRIGVADGNPRLPPRPRRVGPAATSGRGLAWVDDMALAWGARAHPGGKTVWFDVARPDVPAPAHH